MARDINSTNKVAHAVNGNPSVPVPRPQSDTGTSTLFSRTGQSTSLRSHPAIIMFACLADWVPTPRCTINNKWFCVLVRFPRDTHRTLCKDLGKIFSSYRLPAANHGTDLLQAKRRRPLPSIPVLFRFPPRNLPIPYTRIHHIY